MFSCVSPGLIQVEAVTEGGTEPFLFTWSVNGQTFGPTLSNTFELNASTTTLFGVEVSDANSCIANDNFTITLPDQPLDVLLTSIVNADCSGDPTGEIIVSAVGGYGGFQFAWSHDPNARDPFVTGLSGGRYVVTVTDANDCQDSLAVIVEEPMNDLLVAFENVVDVLCAGDSTGAAFANVSGGTEPYQYLWSNGDTTQLLSGVLAGDYTLSVTDGGGCMLESMVSIKEPAALALSFTTTDVACEGGSTGEAIAMASGGTEPYVYKWDINGTEIFSETATNLAPGSYPITVSDANGCEIEGASYY